MKVSKGLLKILTSGELISLLDKNGDGKVSMSEIKQAPFSVWLEIGFKYVPLIISIFL
jgi:hypothetical protein